MKKYLLGLLSISLGFIAFSSAVSITCEDGECTPSQIEVGPGICNNGITNVTFNGSVECEDSEEPCILNFINDDYNQFGILFSNGELNQEESLCMFEGDSNKTFNLQNLGVVNLNGFTLNGGGNEGGNNGGNTGGDSGESGELIGQLTPVIDGLESSMSEFIPYVVYVGLGVLGVIIGFVAIKWLMNYVKGKSLGTFNSRRRK